MTRTTKIVIISASVLVAGSILLIIFGQDERRKKAYSTPVPPQYALDIINQIKAGNK